MKIHVITFKALLASIIGITAIINQAAWGSMAGQVDTGTGSAPGQYENALAGAGNSATDSVGAAGFTTTLTSKSYQIPAGGASPNLEGTACPTAYTMISGACHPFYNKQVAIINQFPNTGSNSWRCGFANNTSAPVTVWIYTLCGQ